MIKKFLELNRKLLRDRRIIQLEKLIQLTSIELLLIRLIENLHKLRQEDLKIIGSLGIISCQE